MEAGETVDGFVNLHCHSEYSLLDGMPNVDEFVKFAVDSGQPAIAITDHGAMGSVYSFIIEARRQGINPICGIELYLVPDPSVKVKGEKRHHITLLAKNWTGVQNLFKLSSKAWIEGFYHRPRAGMKWLKDYSDGVICLSGCMDGVLSKYIQSGNRAKALTVAGQLLDIYKRGNFFIEIMPTKIDVQKLINPELIGIARELKVPLVATPDAHYLKERQPYHKVQLGINSGGKMWDFTDDCFYLCTRADMERLFADNHPNIEPSVIQAALNNTVKLANMVDIQTPSYHNLIPQPYPGLSDDEEFELLRELADKGWGLKGWEHKRDLPQYQERFEYELRQIRSQGFVRYFLVVHNLYQECVLPKGIMYGTGRGSAAGSLICALLSITDPDPIEHGLIFERFIAPDRVNSPDIDMDFEDTRRQEVKDWIIGRYGQDCVANIGTYGTMKGKMVLKDVSRCYGIPVKEVSEVSRFIVERSGGDERASMTVVDTFNEFAACRAFNQKYPQVLPACEALEGGKRQMGIHASGVLISPFPLTDAMPLDVRSGTVCSAFEGTEVDAMGFLKLDVLGIKTLSVIREALELAGLERGDLVKLDYSDSEVLARFHSGDTVGVFQFNSDGMQKLLQSMPVERFSDLVALNALYRPGGMRSGMTNDFVARRAGKQSVAKVDPTYDDITRDTYGLIVYQEQIMEIFGRMAGYSATNIDRMRQKVAKKYGVEDFKKQEDEFIDGCVANGSKREVASEIFHRMIHFASYAFNKSHAHVYTQLSYWCVWLKHYYPHEWFVAALNHENDDNDFRLLFEDAIKNKVNILLPHLNKGGGGAVLVKTDSGSTVGIRLGIERIKGIGPKAVEELEAAAPYANMDDLLSRVNKRIVNKRVQSLITELGLLSKNTYRGWDEDYETWCNNYPMPLGEQLRDKLDMLTADAPHNWTRLDSVAGKSGSFYIRFQMVTVVLHQIGDFGDQTKGKWEVGDRYAIIDVSDGTAMNRIKLDPQKYSQYENIIAKGAVCFARVHKMKDLDTMLFIQTMKELSDGQEDTM